MKYYRLKDSMYETWFVTDHNLDDVGRWLQNMGWTVKIMDTSPRYLVYNKKDGDRYVGPGEVIAGDLDGYVGVWPKDTFLKNFKELRDE